MENPLKLMAILAHPDDESLGLGGTLAKYASEGVEVHLLTATRGERGWPGPEEENPGLAGLGQIREAELRAAADVLGIRQVNFLDYVDGDLGTYGETAIAIAVRPHGAPPTSRFGRMRELFTGGFGVYMHAVPVTEEWPCRAGIEIWGIPKFVGDTSFHVAGKSVTGTLRHDDQMVVSMSVRGGGGMRFPAATFETYTTAAGHLIRFDSSLGGERALVLAISILRFSASVSCPTARAGSTPDYEFETSESTALHDYSTGTCSE